MNIMASVLLDIKSVKVQLLNLIWIKLKCSISAAMLIGLSIFKAHSTIEISLRCLSAKMILQNDLCLIKKFVIITYIFSDVRDKTTVDAKTSLLFRNTRRPDTAPCK